MCDVSCWNVVNDATWWRFWVYIHYADGLCSLTVQTLRLLSEIQSARIPPKEIPFGLSNTSKIFCLLVLVILWPHSDSTWCKHNQRPACRPVSYFSDWVTFYSSPLPLLFIGHSCINAYPLIPFVPLGSHLCGWILTLPLHCGCSLCFHWWQMKPVVYLNRSPNYASLFWPSRPSVFLHPQQVHQRQAVKKKLLP